MKNNLILSTALACVLLFSACLKEKTQPKGNEAWQRPSYERVLESFNWDCTEFESEYYFSGTLNGEDICFGEGVNGYEMFHGGWWSVTTEGNTLSIGEGQAENYRFYNIGFKKATEEDHLIPKLEIKTPYYPSSKDYRDIFEENFREGIYAPAQNLIKTAPKDGFFLDISASYRTDNHDEEYGGNFTISTGPGSQEGSTFEITEVLTRTEGDYKVYDITAEIDCNMYHHHFNFGHEPELYGRLQAEMKLGAKFLLEE